MYIGGLLLARTALELQSHCVGQGTERGRRKFWEWHISMICLCSKYFKNWNIFGQILNIWVKLILKKKLNFFFQCLALPKDPQSFGSQNLRCPFSVSQYYRRRRLCDGEDFVIFVAFLVRGLFRTFALWVLTVIYCPKIVGANSPLSKLRLLKHP